MSDERQARPNAAPDQATSPDGVRAAAAGPSLPMRRTPGRPIAPPGDEILAAPAPASAEAKPPPAREPAAGRVFEQTSARDAGRPGLARHDALVWSASIEGKPIVSLRRSLLDGMHVIDCDVYPAKSLRIEPVAAGPYRFQRSHDADLFVIEAAQCLECLGCEVAAAKN
ncbi:MAG: hypothetical protein ACE5EV_06090 [Gaiellales bacterium]